MRATPLCAPRSSAELLTRCQVVDEVPLLCGRALRGRLRAHAPGPLRGARRAHLPALRQRQRLRLADRRALRVHRRARRAARVDCALGCPSGYRCDSNARVCVPNGGSCSCTPADTFELACAGQAGMREAGRTGLCRARQLRQGRAERVHHRCRGVRPRRQRLRRQGRRGLCDARGAYSLRRGQLRRVRRERASKTPAPISTWRVAVIRSRPSARWPVPTRATGWAWATCWTAISTSPPAASARSRPRATCRVRWARAAPTLDVNCDGADGDVLAASTSRPTATTAIAGSPTRPLRTHRRGDQAGARLAEQRVRAPARVRRRRHLHRDRRAGRWRADPRRLSTRLSCRSIRPRS